MKINIRNKKYWKGDGYYIGRPSPLGNPIPLESTREACIDEYAIWLIQEIKHKHELTMKALEFLFKKLCRDH